LAKQKGKIYARSKKPEKAQPLGKKAQQPSKKPAKPV
jgi:hypothetical protein